MNMMINRKEYSFTAEEGRIVKLVREGKSLDDQITELQAQKKAIDDELIKMADQNMASCNTVHMDGVDCEAIVSFGTSWQFKNEELLKLKRLWGTKKFYTHFKEKVSFSVVKSIESVRNEVGQGKGWKLLVAAIVPKPRAPRITYKSK